MNTDDTQLPELTQRQEQILSLIVRAYSETPEPVSSKSLVETLDVSSATIRNEMQMLEQFGYIAAPHTSAGRVPTQAGYRYFVKRLLSAPDLEQAEKRHISQKLQSLPLATEQWMRQTVALLARTAQSGALVTPPMADASRFKHVELVAIQGRLVLMVLVIQGGALHQQLLTLAEPVPQQRLTEIAGRINSLCPDLDAGKVRVKGVQLGMLEREVIDLIADLMERADSNQIVAVYRDGLSDMLSAFQQNTEGAQQALRVFEERAFLNLILTELLTPQPNDVQIVIGGDGQWEELNHLSMIISRYGLRGQLSGAVGVLGPTHINYGRAISAVRYVSSLMTNMLAHVYEADAPAIESGNQDLEPET